MFGGDFLIKHNTIENIHGANKVNCDIFCTLR
jgi:hypothetical protein